MTFKNILYFLSISNIASFYKHIKNYVYKVKGDEIGRACSTHEATMNAYRILWENKKARKHYDDSDLNGDNIKIDVNETGRGVMDWIDLAQDRDRWRVLVNMEINPRVS
jgi:hypothetical protein